MRDYGELVKELRESAEWADRLAVLMGRDVGDAKAPLMRKAADAIEELLVAVSAQKETIGELRKRNDAQADVIDEEWTSVEERLPERTNPMHARDTYLVRLESGCIKTLFYEYDNSDRCRPGMSPLFSEGWEKTSVPVTHWMPLPKAPKEVE